MKILISAYACEPGRGSEPGVGWNIVKSLAQYHQVWVLTSRTHEAIIEKELSVNPTPNLSFIYLDPLGWVYDWSVEGKRPHWDVHIHYYLWQIWAYFVARSWHQSIGFDLAHHVTYVKYTSPSFLCLLPIPFIWGPVGGGESSPKAFWQDFNWRGKVYEFFRDKARLVGELDPFVRLTASRSTCVFATTEDTAQRLRGIGVKKVELLSEAGLSASEIRSLAQLKTRDSYQEAPCFISMARLLHWKGLHLGIRAFAKANIPNSTYWILGDGPERERLQQLANELGVGNSVKFWGRLSRSEAIQKLGNCLALVHPSLHDSGGWVCLEAMATGCPVVCLDLGGPATQVSDETGFKIKAFDPEQAVIDLASAMIHLHQNPILWNQMSEAGRQRVLEDFNWDAKAILFSEIYKEHCCS
jgi:glycosyltransferase involved in cell wall biosynthesis